MSWTPQQVGIGGGTSAGPSLAEFQGRLFAAWKGAGDDGRMFWSSFLISPAILLGDESHQVRVTGRDFSPDDKATILYQYGVEGIPTTTSFGGPELVSTDSVGGFVFVFHLSASDAVNINVQATDSKSGLRANGQLREE
jgi:hypothetical protein